jgi:WD40 repeat protein
VLAVACPPDAEQCATAGIDGAIRVWSTASGLEGVAYAGHKLWVNALAYHPQGLALASASSDFTVTIWDRPGRKEKHTFAPKAAEVRSLSFSPNRFLAAGTRYGITKVWDGDGAEVASLKGKHGAEVWGVAFSPDGKVLATADGDWNKPSDVVLWNTRTWKERERLKHTNEVLCVAFHPKKPIVAAGAWDKTVRVWDLTELLKDSK